MVSRFRVGSLVVVFFLFAIAGHVLPGEKGTNTISPQAAELPFVELMRSCDLIVVGTPTKVSSRMGAHVVDEVTILRVVASVWSEEQVGKHVVTDAEGTKKIFVVSNTAYNEFGGPGYPGMFLLPGCQFLLWLKQREVPEKDPLAGAVEASASYDVVRGGEGSVPVLDVRLSPHYLPLQKRRAQSGLKGEPYDYLDKHWQRTFGTTNPEEILKMAEQFAVGLLDTRTYMRGLSGESDLHKAAAARLSAIEKPRFQHVELRETEHKQEAAGADEGEAVREGVPDREEPE